MSAAAQAIAVFIGANHSGSWSASEALGAVIGAERYLALEDYPLTPAEALPSFAQELNEASRLIVERPCSPLLVYSHRPLPLHVVLGGRQVRYVTMLRNPVQRFVSYYFWAVLHRTKDIRWVPQVIRDGARLEEYVDHVAATGQYPGGLGPGHYYLTAWQTLGLVPSALTNSMLGAMFILDKYFPVVGITELFDESLFVFACQLGLTTLPRWRMRGKSGAPQIDHLSEAVCAKIRALMHTDLTIYTYYRERFLDRYQREIEIFRSQGLSLRVEGDVDHVAPLV